MQRLAMKQDSRQQQNQEDEELETKGRGRLYNAWNAAVQAA